MDFSGESLEKLLFSRGARGPTQKAFFFQGFLQNTSSREEGQVWGRGGKLAEKLLKQEVELPKEGKKEGESGKSLPQRRRDAGGSLLVGGGQGK